MGTAPSALSRWRKKAMVCGFPLSVTRNSSRVKSVTGLAVAVERHHVQVHHQRLILREVTPVEKREAGGQGGENTDCQAKFDPRMPHDYITLTQHRF